MTGRCDHVRFAAFDTVIGRPDGASFSQTLLRPPGLFVPGVCESFAGRTIAAVCGSNKIPATKLTSIYSLAGQTALATQLASCCCENKQLIGDLKYTIATEDCATRQAIADNARAIVDNCNANFRSMMDYFTQDKIATLTAENQSLKFAASQDRQNALLTTAMNAQTDTILNRVNPRPIPAYQVANPNVGVNCCGCC